MAVKIISSSVYPAELINSSIDLAARAGDKCVDSSGVKKEKIGILIHIGISRDKNVVEPAMACLIQKNMGINTDPVEKHLGHSTFAFDLFNTELGFLYAAQTADGFISSGRAEYVLITSSDVHPSQDVAPEYPFSHVGAAALLAKSDDHKTGFQHYFFKTIPDGYQGYYSYIPLVGAGLKGRSSLNVDIDENFENRSLDFAVSVVKEFAEVKKVNIADVKFLITSQFYKDFGKKLSKEIGLSENNAVDTYDKYGNPHTSTLIAGYNHLKQSNLISPGDKIMFVGVGAGLSIGVGLYVA